MIELPKDPIDIKIYESTEINLRENTESKNNMIIENDS